MMKKRIPGSRALLVSVLVFVFVFVVVFVQLGSAQVLMSGFDESNEGWRSDDAGLSWQSPGGNVGGFLQGKGGEDWYYASPKSWAGDWTRYAYGRLSFDLRAIVADGDPSFADIVRIYGSDGTYISWSGDPPRGTWTGYQISLTPATFRIAESEFLMFMRDVDKIEILGGFTDSKDTTGLDNVVVAPPPTLDLASDFDLGDEGWRPANDVAIRWRERGGASGGFLLGEDLGAGEVWYYVSPRSWSGDWTAYIGGGLNFDLKLLDDGGGETYPGDLVRIYASDGSFVSFVSSPRRSPGVSWTRWEVPLIPSLFGTTMNEFRKIMGDVDQVWIRGEYSDRMDVEGLDNVMVTLPSVGDRTSRFDRGCDGWRPGNDVSPSWGEEASGNGYLHGEDLGKGSTWYFVTPLSWSGDWIPYVGGILSFDLMVIDDRDGDDIAGDTVRIYGSKGARISWSGDSPGKTWTHYQVLLTPATFGESEKSFLGIMRDVEGIWIKGEYSNQRDSEGLDNVTITLGPAPVV